MTYAYTGCSGAVASEAAVRFAFEPPNLQSPDITVPVRHGLYLLFPHYWVGELEQPVPLPEQSAGSTYSSDIDVARQHPYWRDPELPAGWGLSSVEVGFEGIDGYVAYYHDSLGGGGAVIQVRRVREAPRRFKIWDAGSPRIYEARLIDGLPAVIGYSPSGSNTHASELLVYDRESQLEYVVIGLSPSVAGSDDAVIAIARSLYRTQAP